MSKTINDLTTLSSPADDDLIPIEDVSAGATKAITRKNLMAGMPVQAVVSNSNAVATGSTIMPYDDTIPQKTEGDQYMTVSITPKSATSVLEIEVIAQVAAHIANKISGAVFQDTTSNALAAAAVKITAADDPKQLKIKFTMTAGTTSSTTFKFRAGVASADTMTFNGANAARIFGAITKSYMKVTELAG